MLKMIGLVATAYEVILKPPEAVFFGPPQELYSRENYRPGPDSIRSHFEAARGRFLRLKAVF